MARFVDLHPDNPQPRAIAQTVALLRDGGVIAYPTDSCYALGCSLDSPGGADRIRRIRGLDAKHHLTLVCAEFGQLGRFVQIDNAAFRSIKAATPGPYTFILPATREVPKRLSHPKKRTIGVRIPRSAVVQALLRELGAPLLSSTLLLPGDQEPLTDGWSISERLGPEIDAVLDAGECGTVPSTVVDWSEGSPEVLRVGAGDPDRFA